MTMSELKTEMEYWCGWGHHWVPDVRVGTYGVARVPGCKTCTGLTDEGWDEMLPLSREKPKPRFVVFPSYRGARGYAVMDGQDESMIDMRLSETQAEVIAELRNQWEAEK